MRSSVVTDCFLAAGFTITFSLLTGCGVDFFGAQENQGPAPAPLQCPMPPGTYAYRVAELGSAMDGCEILGDEGLVGSTFKVHVDSACAFEIDGIGKGQVVNDKGTLTSEGHSVKGACSFDYTSTFSTSVDQTELSGTFSETDEHRSLGCVPDNEQCSSDWTMTLQLAK